MKHQVDTDELGRLPCQLRPAAVGKSYLELLRSDGILAAGKTKTKHEKVAELWILWDCWCQRENNQRISWSTLESTFD